MKRKLIVFILMFCIVANGFALSRRNIRKLYNSSYNFSGVVTNYVLSLGRPCVPQYQIPYGGGFDMNEVDRCFWEYESGEGIYAITVPSPYGGGWIVFIGYDGWNVTNVQIYHVL